jgi:hypothetical protein
MFASSVKGNHLSHSVEQSAFEDRETESNQVDQFANFASNPFVLSMTPPLKGGLFVPESQQSSLIEMAKKRQVKPEMALGMTDLSAEPTQPVVSHSDNSYSYAHQTSYFGGESAGIQNAPLLVDQKAEMKLRYKIVADSIANKRDAALYEDFSDSDESFAGTTHGHQMAPQGVSQLPSFNEPHSSMMLARSAPTSDDIAWVNSTDAFLRKLQQPRAQQSAAAEKPPGRLVTIGPKKDKNERIMTASDAKTTLHDDSEPESERPKEQILFQTVVPLEELKTIRKTIFVSDKTHESTKSVVDKSSIVNQKTSKADIEESKTELSKMMKLDGCKVTAVKGNEVTKKIRKEAKLCGNGNMQENQCVSILDERANAERQRKIKLLFKELEGLRRQQSLLWRRKRQQKDGHNDPVLAELSKLQEDISNQIALLKQEAGKHPTKNEPTLVSSYADNEVCVIKLLFFIVVDSFSHYYNHFSRKSSYVLKWACGLLGIYVLFCCLCHFDGKDAPHIPMCYLEIPHKFC